MRKYIWVLKSLTVSGASEAQSIMDFPSNSDTTYRARSIMDFPSNSDTKYRDLPDFQTSRAMNILMHCT